LVKQRTIADWAAIACQPDAGALLSTHKERNPEIPTVVKVKGNPFGDAATIGVIKKSSDHKREERQHIEGCNPG
jgi:hypothetical protein